MNTYDAYSTAVELLSPELPRRLLHTKGVAETAERLARVLVPRPVNDIITAAWLHDIGYAPGLVDTGFHPVDGARYARAAGFSENVVSLIAHHTGALIEADERGLSDRLGEYPVPPDAVELAILSCADLCTGPDGTPVDPGERIAEVLQRYPATDPVHRALARSGPALVDQARLVLAAAETAHCQRPRLDVPSISSSSALNRPEARSQPNPTSVTEGLPDDRNSDLRAVLAAVVAAATNR
ncbi:HD domain-containing protein [Mycolicibacterium fortuitum]|uniref:HD domain-containing protein n=1 Tax=Mycolicibacterium fortuitum TaxID=1766 RepID=UPI0037C961DB